MEKHLNDNTAGYYLVYVVDDQWLFTTGSIPFAAGTLRQVTDKALSLGFQKEDLKLAMEEMEKHGHNATHFGMYKGFMFTLNKEFDYDLGKAS